MIVTPIKTVKVTPGKPGLFELLDESLSSVAEGSVLAVSSKIIALCENGVIPESETDKEALITQESDYYLPTSFNKYGYHFAIKNDTLAGAAGIDKSNGDGFFVLWPKDSQKAANEIRKFLAGRFGLKKVGVVVTDSTSQPLRRGTIGQLLAHSGFRGLNNYVGRPDLFGRPFVSEQANVAAGLAAAAVLAQGEGAEQTPLCLISDFPLVEFVDRDPTPNELAELYIPMEDDLFAPFLLSAPWQRGRSGSP
jgi:F420-0:gamma-glutamyl ligase